MVPGSVSGQSLIRQRTPHAQNSPYFLPPPKCKCNPSSSSSSSYVHTRTHCVSATERVRHSTFSGVGLSLNNIIQTGIVSTFPLRFPTERLHRMKHRKWRETKQQPSTARPGNTLGCCFVSLHFLFYILCSRSVQP